MLETNDLAVAARLWARVALATDEIRTLESLSLPSRCRAIIAISKIDLDCAATRLRTSPDSLELEHLGRWLEMVESQLRTVRFVLTAIGPFEVPNSRTA
jgi:hypothetical protein